MSTSLPSECSVLKISEGTILDLVRRGDKISGDEGAESKDGVYRAITSEIHCCSSQLCRAGTGGARELIGDVLIIRNEGGYTFR